MLFTWTQNAARSPFVMRMSLFFLSHFDSYSCGCIIVPVVSVVTLCSVTSPSTLPIMNSICSLYLYAVESRPLEFTAEVCNEADARLFPSELGCLALCNDITTTEECRIEYVLRIGGECAPLFYFLFFTPIHSVVRPPVFLCICLTEIWRVKKVIRFINLNF